MSIKIRDLSYTYSLGNNPSLIDITLFVPTGHLMILTGSSGSGKSTVLRAVAGLIPSYFQGKLSGEIEIAGRTTHRLPLSEVARTVGYLNQNPEQGFFSLTVSEELLTSLYWQNMPANQAQKRLEKVSIELGIIKLLDKWVSELSAGEKQKVALASLLINPLIRTLVLDEPSANLDKNSAEELAQILERLLKEGYTILLADHRLYWLRDVASSVVVLKNGKIVLEGNFDSLCSPAFRETYSLRTTEVLTNPNFSPSPSLPLLSWENLYFSYSKHSSPIFDNFSGSIGEGIFALVGENGSGKSTLARLLSGLKDPKGGSIFWKGIVAKRRKRQILSSIVPQNVDRILYTKSVIEEVCESSGKKISEKEALKLLAQLNLENVAERHPQSLSGGQKQRLACASILASPSQILIFDEPTSGLDSINMHLIGDALKQCVNEERSVLLITHDEEFLSSYAHSQIKLKKLNP